MAAVTTTGLFGVALVRFLGYLAPRGGWAGSSPRPRKAAVLLGG